MSSRKQKRKTQRPDVDLFQQARRHYEKRNFKQALKDAKVCYRQRPTEASHQLLEQAYLARARELERMGLAPQAREDVRELARLGVTEPGVRQELPTLLAALGMTSEEVGLGRDAVPPEARRQALETSADRAVVRSRPEAAVDGELRRGAGAVRAALAAVHEGDEAGATAALQQIAHRSPFADWKLFVRGLAAYYRRDRNEMLANWDRLDPTRAAVRIARTLRTLMDAEGPGAASAARVLERPALGTAVLGHLAALQTHLAGEDVDGVLAELRRARTELRHLEPALRERVVLVLTGWAVRRADADLLRGLTRLLDPPAIDPRWHRAWALLWEHPDEGDAEYAEESWLAYIEDLPHVTALAEDERTLAASLVWLRLGRQLTVEAWDAGMGPGSFVDPDDPDGLDGPDDDQVGELRQRAVEYFTRSFRTTPELAPAYRELAAAQQAWGRPEQAAQTFEELLRHVPDDVDALLFVGRHELQHGDPLRGRELIVQAHRLRPLDARVTGEAWAAHLRAARADAEAGRWDEGRRAFAAAEQLDPRGERRLHRLARQAVFEFKAGQSDLGEQLAEQAQAACPEPAPALLLMAAEAARYRLPRTIRDRFNREWRKALKGRCTSSTAGLMAEQMASYLAGDVEYAGRAEHVRGVLAYVRRSSRVQYQPEDLRHVCQFLLAAEQPDDLAKMIRKGRKKFPEHPYFHLMAGETEMSKGPFDCNRRAAIRAFEQALDLAEDFDHPDAGVWADVARKRLTFFEQVGTFAAAVGPDELGGKAMPSSPGELIDVMAEVFERMGIDPDEAFEELLDDLSDELPPETSPERPEPRRQKKAKTKRKKK